VENRDLPAPPTEWAMFGMPMAVNHIAKFDRRVEHGMTHSLYIHDPNGCGVELVYELPREVWEGDIDGALNWVGT
jgi:catechol 2,3-dioxygenase